MLSATEHVLLGVRKIRRHKAAKAGPKRRALPPHSAIIRPETQLQPATGADPQAVISRNAQPIRRGGSKLANKFFGVIAAVELPKTADACGITHNQPRGAATVRDGGRAGLLFEAFELPSGPVERVKIPGRYQGGYFLGSVSIQIGHDQSFHG